MKPSLLRSNFSKGASSFHSSLAIRPSLLVSMRRNIASPARPRQRCIFFIAASTSSLVTTLSPLASSCANTCLRAFHSDSSTLPSLFWSMRSNILASMRGSARSTARGGRGRSPWRVPWPRPKPSLLRSAFLRVVGLGVHGRPCLDPCLCLCPSPSPCLSGHPGGPAGLIAAISSALSLPSPSLSWRWMILLAISMSCSGEGPAGAVTRATLAEHLSELGPVEEAVAVSVGTPEVEAPAFGHLRLRDLAVLVRVVTLQETGAEIASAGTGGAGLCGGAAGPGSPRGWTNPSPFLSSTAKMRGLDAEFGSGQLAVLVGVFPGKKLVGSAVLRQQRRGQQKGLRLGSSYSCPRSPKPRPDDRVSAIWKAPRD